MLGGSSCLQRRPGGRQCGSRPVAARPKGTLRTKLKCRAFAAAQAPALQPSTAAAGLGAGQMPLSYRALTTDPKLADRRAERLHDPPGAAQLMSRQLTLNPLHGISSWLEARMLGIDLGMAVMFDRNPAMHAAAAVATATITVLGLHPFAMWRHGLPAAVVQWAETSLLGWIGLPVVWAVLAASGAAAALWQLRTWWGAHLALIRLEEQLQQQEEQQTARAEGAASNGNNSIAVSSMDKRAAAAASAGPFSPLIPSVLQGIIEPAWKPTDKTWLYVIMATRLATLSLAATSVVSGHGLSAVAYSAVCFAVSMLPLGLPHLRHLLSMPGPAAPSGSGAGATAAPSPGSIGLPLVAADAAFLAALAPVSAVPLALHVAAGGALAAGLAAAATGAAASGRLSSHCASVGDEVTFHVTLRLPSGTPLDTTLGHRPLRAIVAPRPPADAASDEEQEGPDNVSLSGFSAMDSMDAVQGDWSVDPTAAWLGADAALGSQMRFELLRQVLACSVLHGMYVGETRTCNLQNELVGDEEGGLGSGTDADALATLPPPAPYVNPGLVWWQPLDDMYRKMKLIPRAGDLLMYPLGALVQGLGAVQQHLGGGHAPVPAMAGALPASAAAGWGPVRVGAVTPSFVELDGNVGAEAEAVEVEVRVVSVAKAQQRTRR